MFGDGTTGATGTLRATLALSLRAEYSLLELGVHVIQSEVAVWV
jgi:hypothetical protein